MFAPAIGIIRARLLTCWGLVTLILSSHGKCDSPVQDLRINGGPLQMVPRNGWKAFEVISVGNNPGGDGIDSRCRARSTV